MNRKDVIEVLKMENDLITFDPATGEDIDVSCLNDLNKKCYIAHEQAIEFLKQSISIEWLHDIMKKQLIFAMSSEMEGTTTVKDGVITAVGTGTVEITVTSVAYGVSAKCRVTVK